jgi:ATP-dependent Lon protease
MFIGAANDLDTIHPALRDRFEVIELPPYTQDEKLAIVSRYVLPRMRETHFLSDEQVHVSEDALAALAKRSASAPGVRPLESDLRRLLRRAVLLLQEGEAHVSIDAETVADWLGPATGRRSVGFAPPPR